MCNTGLSLSSQAVIELHPLVYGMGYLSTFACARLCLLYVHANSFCDSTDDRIISYPSANAFHSDNVTVLHCEIQHSLRRSSMLQSNLVAA